MSGSVVHKTDDVGAYVGELGRRARMASRVMAGAATGAKDAALLAIADALLARQAGLVNANGLDLKSGRANGLEPALMACSCEKN